jgi:DcuC family C4-dicarboxylate transporter
MTTWIALAIIGAAVIAIVWKVDVRLALVSGGLALGTLANNPTVIVRTFFATLTKEQFVVPICCAMGFAHVLRQTRCDRDLIYLLVRPLQRVRGLLVPGTVVVGFVINTPVVSQTSTAVAIGTVLVPLLRAAGVSAVTIGSALLLGCSIGGELLNPGAPEFRTVSVAAGAEPNQCVERVFPLIVPHLAVATLLFWLLSRAADSRQLHQDEAAGEKAEEEPILQRSFRVNWFRAAVPLLPITLLFLSGPPINLISVPEHWLVDPHNPGEALLFSSRRVGAAMLIGVVAAALSAGRASLATAKAFFEGAGYAFTHIISVIVAAECFGAGVRQVGLAEQLGDVMRDWPGLLLPIAGALPWAFAWVSGSGMASTQSVYGFFVDPARSLGVDPVHVGAVVSIGAAAGRTMSPVAAVTLMCATMTGTDPVALIRRTAAPLIGGLLVVVLVAMWVAAR